MKILNFSLIFFTTVFIIEQNRYGAVRRPNGMAFHQYVTLSKLKAKKLLNFSFTPMCQYAFDKSILQAKLFLRKA